MRMIAIVREVRANSLLVRDISIPQDVIVHTDTARRFCVGDKVSILYSGVMTRSIPPQITAIRIRRIFSRGRCR